MSDDLDKLSFEEAYRELEDTIQRLEAGDLTLDSALGLYERGMHLAHHCTDVLDAAENRVQELVSTSDRQQMGMFLDDQD
jgi:exodeoxyribonuclease VII small subunit